MFSIDSYNTFIVLYFKAGFPKCFLFWVLSTMVLQYLDSVNETHSVYALIVCSQIDSLTTLGKRKVCALALCILLTLREAQILDRLEQILRFGYLSLNIQSV
jgi:hypothetical protein